MALRRAHRARERAGALRPCGGDEPRRDRPAARNLPADPDGGARPLREQQYGRALRVPVLRHGSGPRGPLSEHPGHELDPAGPGRVQGLARGADAPERRALRLRDSPGGEPGRVQSPGVSRARRGLRAALARPRRGQSSGEPGGHGAGPGHRSRGDEPPAHPVSPGRRGRLRHLPADVSRRPAARDGGGAPAELRRPRGRVGPARPLDGRAVRSFARPAGGSGAVRRARGEPAPSHLRPRPRLRGDAARAEPDGPGHLRRPDLDAPPLDAACLPFPRRAARALLGPGQRPPDQRPRLRDHAAADPRAHRGAPARRRAADGRAPAAPGQRALRAGRVRGGLRHLRLEPAARHDGVDAGAHRDVRLSPGRGRPDV